MILKTRFMYIKRYIHIHRDIWRGTQKFAELKEKYLKYSYKFETLVTFKTLPLWLDSAIPAPLLLLETLPKTFNRNAVKGRQRFSLNPCYVSKTPPFWLKTKRWLCLPPSSRPTSLLATVFCAQGWIRIWKGGAWLMLQRFNENRWRFFRAFPLKIVDILANSGCGTEIAESSHRGTILKGTKVRNLYNYFKYFFQHFREFLGHTLILKDTNVMAIQSKE
jgi:hypothetical protein